MSSPYENLPPSAFWRTAVAERPRDATGALYSPTVAVTRQTRIATAGSCFAQRIGQQLRDVGCWVIDAEGLPKSIPDAEAQKFGYRQYSARYGNIYTARHLLQLVQEAHGQITPVDAIWQREGRYFDALRPAVEPNGFARAADVSAHREIHLKCVRQAFGRADIMIFTFGLTECWLQKETGTTYPTAPGTIAGSFDPDVHAFHNCGYAETLAAFEATRTLLQQHNPRLRFIITVSPQPPTATASGQHVEVASARTKAILRAVCGELNERHDDVDYFPAYEIATSQHARARHFAANLRTMTQAGVAAVMAEFFNAHGLGADDAKTALGSDGAGNAGGDVMAGDDGDADDCEDALLDAFAR